MNVADELHKLEQLHRSGAIDDHEFARAKAKVLYGDPEVEPHGADWPGAIEFGPVAQEEQTRQWAMLLHLSLLTGFVVPFAGFVAPIIIWQLKKTELPGIDVHGKNVLNWLISKIIYAFVSGILVFVVIGIPLLIALAIVAVIFPIIAGIKASNGEVWKYPLAIAFLK